MGSKIKLTTALILVISLFVPNAAFANAAPVYLERYPSFNMAPMDDCPIRVERENLTFKITERSASEANVTATYTLLNTSAETINVPMIFPFVSDGYGGIGAEIKFNGQALDYEIFIAGSVDVRDYLGNPEAFNQQVEIDKIINNLNEPLYEPQYFDDNARATLYEVTFKPPTERQSQISFNLDTEKTRVLTFGFSGFSINENGDCTVSTYVGDRDLERTCYLLVLGKDSLNILSNAYDDVLARSSVNAKEFIMHNLTNNEHFWLDDNRNIENFYAMFIKEIDRSFEEWQLVSSESMVMEQIFNLNNISVLLYEVEFEADSINEMRLTYPMSATLDKTKTMDYVNTFAYILNPAKKFSGFGGIDIRIELNSESPYIIESSMPLREDNRGIYTTSLDRLPDQDLVFSTYPKKEVTFIDSTAAQILPQGYGGMFAGLVAAGLFFSAIVMTTYLVVKRKRKSN